jgi:citronellol/citronellal dehydrogenase
MSVLRQGIHGGTVAVVTGGGTGIGRAVALELARCGADVVICGRRREPLEKTAAEIEALGVRVLAVPADVRDDVSVRHLVGSALERFGHIDTLVNNAGGQFAAPAEQITGKGWRAVHRLTVDAAWAVTREVAVRAMIPQRSGAIFFMAFSPRRGITSMVHASSARAALENLAPGWLWNGAGSASGPSALQPARSRPRGWRTTTRKTSAPGGKLRYRSVASAPRKRSPG